MCLTPETLPAPVSFQAILPIKNRVTTGNGALSTSVALSFAFDVLNMIGKIGVLSSFVSSE
jgi:hypothetical protein